MEQGTGKIAGKPSVTEAGEKRLVSVVVPVYNEEAGVCGTIERITGLLGKLPGAGFEIIAVDDGSTDSTWERLKTMASGDKRVRLIGFTRNFGKEAAILAGLKGARGDAVVVIDADLQHPPELIPQMISLWKDGKYEVVHAAKEKRQPESLFKRVSAALFYGLMRLFSGIDLRNSTDFKLLDRKAVDGYLALPEKIRFFRGLIPWFGFNNVTVPFSPGARSGDKGKWGLGGLIGFGFRAICSFSSLPLQAVTVSGLIMFAVSVVLGIETLAMKFTGRAATGFTTVIILLLFIGSMLMMSLGLIGQYLAMIYEEIKGRPSYLIDRTINMETTDIKGPA